MTFWVEKAPFICDRIDTCHLNALEYSLITYKNYEKKHFCNRLTCLLMKQMG